MGGGAGRVRGMQLNPSTCFSSVAEIQVMLSALLKETERVTEQAKIADGLKRSDRREWALRAKALFKVRDSLEALSVQVLVTSGRTPLI